MSDTRGESDTRGDGTPLPPRGSGAPLSIRRPLAVVSIILAATALAACGGKDQSTSTASTAKAQTTSTTSTTASGSKATVAVGDPAWAANATALRGQNGTSHAQECPPNPGKKAGSVWGAGTYTDDSSICTAAVQSGLISFTDGGKVTFEIADGKASYDGGTANGVTSSTYGRWDGSFTFPDAPPGSVAFGPDPASWEQNMSAKRGQNGTRETIDCSPGGTPGSVWGSGPYTDDSSVCTAAVHAGVITVAEGGPVTVEIAPGQESYKGSTANGVTTSDYGSFGGSFKVIMGG